MLSALCAVTLSQLHCYHELLKMYCVVSGLWSVSSLAIFYPCVLLPDNLIPSCRTLLHFLTLKSEARTRTEEVR